MSPAFDYYHVHIYCTVEEIPQCQVLREKLLHELADCIEGAGPVRHRPVGPHPLPMFEAWFESDPQLQNLKQVTQWVLKNRGHFSALIHPLSGNELDDHTKYAQWIGTPLKLDLSIF